jgi:hypothetical protein
MCVLNFDDLQTHSQISLGSEFTIAKKNKFNPVFFLFLKYNKI